MLRLRLRLRLLRFPTGCVLCKFFVRERGLALFPNDLHRRFRRCAFKFSDSFPLTPFRISSHALTQTFNYHITKLHNITLNIHYITFNIHTIINRSIPNRFVILILTDLIPPLTLTRLSLNIINLS